MWAPRTALLDSSRDDKLKRSESLPLGMAQCFISLKVPTSCSETLNRVKDFASRHGESVRRRTRGQGGAYIAVAIDHVIESFRNRLWADYKTDDGIERALLLTAL